jgi:hypothetical protein
MKVAVFTFVFNESVNLPIWLRYYGTNFGPQNMYVIDRNSTDGSTVNLGDVNVIKLPRDAFDEYKRATFISRFHECLLQYYDVVIFTDTDEILVPDLGKYANLADFLNRKEFDYITAVGLNISHAIHLEEPIDLNRPLMEQRKYARFFSAQCKTLISRVPVCWLPGFHCANHRPQFDPELFIFHIKLVDFYEALKRQRVNRETEWASTSLAYELGSHHRWDNSRFAQEGFFTTVDLLNRGQVTEFDFGPDIDKVCAGIVEKDGFYLIPMGHSRLVEIPERFRSAF